MLNSEKIVNFLLAVTAISMAIYHLAYTQYPMVGPNAHLILHLGFALAVVLLALIKKEKKRRWLILLLLIGALLHTSYLMINLNEILMYRLVTPLPADIINGCVGVLIVLVTIFLMFGKTFPIITLIAIAYLFFGRYLPYPFTVADVDFTQLIVWLAVGIQGGEGLYGSILGVSANYLFLFIFFGGLLHGFGGTRFIIALGKWFGSKLKCGPAAVAVIGSSLLGTITGTSAGNVAITGSFTIPMMKNAGYTPEQAGAIEATSSNGGQIMPPIMGATAFIMSGFAGIPYIEIVTAAIIPALLYYFSVFLYVQLTAIKMNVVSKLEPISGIKLLLDAPIFIIPIIVLVVLLIKGFTLPFVGFWSMMSLILISIISSVRPDARLTLKGVVSPIVDGIRTACEVAVVIGSVGLIATCLKVSGLGIKLPMLIEDISYGYLIAALFITMVSSTILGMGVPAPVAYILVAIGAVPALLRMGVPVLQAHFFCFFFSVFSHITPPVAFASLVASRMSGGDYWKTSWEAVKAASTAFLLPFFIIYSSVIVFQGDYGYFSSIIQIVGIIFLISSLQIGLSSYCFVPLKIYERISMYLSAFLYFVALINKNYYFFSIALALFCITISLNFYRKKIIFKS